MKKNAGFTLMELMVVIAIIGILSAIAVPNVISWRSTAQINSAARDVYSNLLHAKSMAVKENMNCQVVFDVANQSYTLSMVNPIAGGPGGRTLKTVALSSYGGVDLYSADFTGAPSITFGATGFPFNAAGALSGGTIVLSGSVNRTIVLTASGNVRIEYL